MAGSRRRTTWSSLVAVVLIAYACRDAIAPRTGSVFRLAPVANLVTLDSAKRLTLTNICGNRFRARNPLGDTVRVHWDVYHTSDSGDLTLPARPAGGSYSETFFTTRATGTTRLFFHGTLIQTAENNTHRNDAKGNDSKGNKGRGDDGKSDEGNKEKGDNNKETESNVCPGNLLVVAGEGVLGLQSGSTVYTNGTTLSYGAQPDAGYTSVRLFLDTREVPATGTIKILGAMTLVAFALPDSSSPPVDAGLMQRFQGLLTSNTQVSDYQSLIYAASALADQVGPARTDTVLRASADAAFRFPRDSSALAQLEQTLAGHSFDAESLPPVEPVLPFGPGATLPFGFPSNGASAPPLGGSRVAAPSSRAQIWTPGSRVNVTITPPPSSSNPRPVDVVHVNGLVSNADGFVANIQALRSAVREQPLLNDSRHTRVTGFYNQNVGLAAVRLRSTPCALALNPHFVHGLPLWIRLQLNTRCTPADLRRLGIDGGGDLLETWTQLLDIFTGSPPSFASATLDSLVAVQLRAKRGGNHVIVVPHSQGNLFEIESLSKLAQGGNAPTDGDAACVGMVPTASPTSVGYPISSQRLRPVQVLGDFILNTPLPTFPAVSTQLYQALSGDRIAAAEAVAGLSPFPYPIVRWIRDQFRLHEFIGSYLATIGARSLVQQAITDVYANCEVGLTATANPLLPIGSTERISLAITGADGRGLSPIVPITWQSSDTAVASVDGSGVLTGRAEGMVRVTASYRNQHADALVEVFSTSPDASVTVVVQNTSADVVPFWLGISADRVWRRRDVTVSVTPNDSTTSVDFYSGGVAGYDSYNTFFSSDPIRELSTGGSRTLKFATLFYDNPRTTHGIPIRFGADNRLWIMGDDVLVTFHTLGHGYSPDKTHWVRVPLTHP